LASALRSIVSASSITLRLPVLFDDFLAVESGEVGLAPCLRPLAQTARAVFPQAAFLCGRFCNVEAGFDAGHQIDQPHEPEFLHQSRKRINSPHCVPPFLGDE
jgi:hypothetical protein